jgi:NAD(P)-dependent dehydrogenase (short-subunit alcohol dehydrogenase family)
VAYVERAGRRAVAAQANVAVENAVERLFVAVDAKLGRVSHLVCNTG